MNKTSLRRCLLRWYDRHRRRLPWREKPSPYRTWVSEIMLQQTQVSTVLPYYERFVKRFPDARTLSRASEDSVLRRWSGLGYYSRARNLHRAAKMVEAEYLGRIPNDIISLRRLPGVGPYSAAAISSIAFARPHAVVDGNVARVFSRLFGVRGDAKAPKTLKRFWEIAERLMADCRRPGDWNQALMELGALVCLPQPKGPRCGECPLAPACFAKKHDLQDKLPEAGAKAKPVAVAWTAYLIRRGGDLLLWRRSKSEKFLPEHWGLPEDRHIRSAKPGKLVRKIRHTITHHRIKVAVRQADLSGGRPPRQARWFPARRAASVLVSSLWLKAIGENRR